MRFRQYDNLRVFNVVAQYGSLTAASEELNLTKGAVSHQIRQLEAELGFEVFNRSSKGVSLNQQGTDLLEASQSAFSVIEQKIAEIRQSDTHTLTIGMSTYFASRWLSPRLMHFMQSHPDIRMRVQPMIDLLDLKGEGIDLSIRWGRGDWDDVTIEKLFACPAFPTGNEDAYRLYQNYGLEAFQEYTLLRDRDDSNAWSHWYDEAGIIYEGQADSLIIPDPNVRVQAVIDGQGIALNDDLVNSEIDAGRLFRIGDVGMPDYGYFLAYGPGMQEVPEVRAFIDWIKTEV